MDFYELEQLLERGERVGFVKPTDDLDYLGWILIAKIKANQRFLGLVTENDAPERFREERRRSREPYLLLQLELKRSVHEEGGYETEADYRQKDRLWFATLDDLAQNLQESGFDIRNARLARDLDAP